MDQRLLWSILSIFPFLSIITAICYFIMVRPTGKEAIFVLLAIIPGLNVICGIILILNALGVISL